MNEGLEEVPCLRGTARHTAGHKSGNRIGRADRVRGGVVKERHDGASGGQPDAQHERILCGVHQLVHAQWIEALSYAESRGIGSPWKRNGPAISKRPIGIRDASLSSFSTLTGLRHVKGQTRF